MGTDGSLTILLSNTSAHVTAFKLTLKNSSMGFHSGLSREIDFIQCFDLFLRP